MALGAGVVLLAGLGLAAVQIAPTLEFSGLSTRGEGLDYAMATYESLDPKELLAFLIPDIFGNAVDQTYWKSRDIWHFWESCGYVGILPLWLAFVRTEEPSLRRMRVFFLLLLGVALMLALGKYNPLYAWIYRLPGFNSFRLPTQIIFLYIFGIAAVSGKAGSTQRGSWKWNRGFILSYSRGGSCLFSNHRFFRFFLKFLSFGRPVTMRSGLYNRSVLLSTQPLLFCCLAFCCLRKTLRTRTVSLYQRFQDLIPLASVRQAAA
jgi:hypothetical protein